MSRAKTGVLLPLLPGGSQGRAFPPCRRGKAESSGHPNCKGRDAARSQDRWIPGQYPVQLDQAEGQGWGSGQAAPGWERGRVSELVAGAQPGGGAS